MNPLPSGRHGDAPCNNPHYCYPNHPYLKIHWIMPTSPRNLFINTSLPSCHQWKWYIKQFYSEKSILPKWTRASSPHDAEPHGSKTLFINIVQKKKKLSLYSLQHFGFSYFFSHFYSLNNTRVCCTSLTIWSFPPRLRGCLYNSNYRYTTNDRKIITRFSIYYYVRCLCGITWNKMGAKNIVISFYHIITYCSFWITACKFEN